MAAVDEHVVMANPATGDVVVVTKTEFEKVWSRQGVVDSRGFAVLESPWKLASEVDGVTAEQVLDAAHRAGVKLPEPDSDGGTDDREPDDLIAAIEQPPVGDIDDTPGV